MMNDKKSLVIDFLASLVICFLVVLVVSGGFSSLCGVLIYLLISLFHLILIRKLRTFFQKK